MSDIAGKSYTGTDGNDNLKGSRGDDTISTGLGFDTITAGAGDDTLWVMSNKATVDGGSGADDIYLGFDYDMLATVNCTGGAGDDTITSSFAGIIDSTLSGGAGNDWIVVTAQNTSVLGGSGADILSTSGANNTVLGGDGQDDVSAYNEKDAADSFLFGGSGDDTVAASGWNIAAHGDAGNDTLWGNGSDISLTGGTGKDRFGVQYVLGGEFDGDTVKDTRMDIVIEDFTRGQDKLWIAADLSGKDKLSFAELQLTDSAEGLHVSHAYTTPYYDTTTVVDFLLVGVHEISAHDLHFVNSLGV